MYTLRLSATKIFLELMDFLTPEFDKIQVIVKQKYNKSGTKVLDSQVVSLEQIF